MWLYNLGTQSVNRIFLLSQLLAEKGTEALVLTSPDAPLVSIGLTRKSWKRLNISYCQENNIAIVPREIGRHTLYLEPEQLIVQLVLKKNNPIVPITLNDKFKFFSEILRDALREKMKLRLNFCPPNDLMDAKGCKIGWLEIGEIGHCVILVGALYGFEQVEIISNLWHYPDEIFKEYVCETAAQSLTSLDQQFKNIPSREELSEMVISQCKEIMGLLLPDVISEYMKKEIDYYEEEVIREEHSFSRERNIPLTKIQLSGYYSVFQGLCQTDTGIIIVLAEAIKKNHSTYLKRLHLSGNFPPDLLPELRLLEKILAGKMLNEKILLNTINKFYKEHNLVTPGIEPKIFVEAILKGFQGETL